MKPARMYVLAERLKRRETTASGLYVPTTGDKQDITAVVLAVGEGTEEFPAPAKVGEVIVHEPHRFISVDVEDSNNDRDTILVHFDAIIATM